MAKESLGSIFLFHFLSFTYSYFASRISVLKADNLPTLLRISNLHLQLGEVDSAISSLRSCLQSDPEHKECSKLFRRLKKLSKSIARAQESMEKNRHRDALGPDALNADQTGKDGAMVFMNELNITGAAKKKVLNMICECYAKLKSHDRAVRWCSDAIETDPETTINYCYRGDSYLGKEEFEAGM
jgi:DnaJ family protein C protein 3